MYNYSILEPGCYYLVQEQINSPISLIKVSVETDQCFYILKYDEPMVSYWKKKEDPLHDVIECLDDAAVNKWEKYYNNEDAYYEEGDDE